MTDLDIYFWRFFAFGLGFGLIFINRQWLMTMGRACRHWLTIPGESRYVYNSVYEAMTDLSKKNPHVLQAEWYRRYIAFREVGCIP